MSRPTWYVLTRFPVGRNTPPPGGEYPREGYPLSISVDKNKWGNSVDGKEFRVVTVTPISGDADAKMILELDDLDDQAIHAAIAHI
jgi:hypothetical protein